MAALKFLFGFEGRLARGRFWVFGLALYALATVALAFDPAMDETLRHVLWLPGAVVLYVYIFTGMWGFSVAVLTLAVDVFLINHTGGRAGMWLFLVALALCLVLGWMVIAVASKRLHDRGKSGWWLLLFVVAPLLLVQGAAITGSAAAGMLYVYEGLFLHLWSFVEMGCRRGVRGSNAYGRAPPAAL